MHCTLYITQRLEPGRHNYDMCEHMTPLPGQDADHGLWPVVMMSCLTQAAAALCTVPVINMPLNLTR